MKIKHAGKLHPRFNKKVSVEQRLLTSLALKKFYSENTHHNKGKLGKLAPQFGIGGKEILMTNQNGKVLSFPSINAARQHFRVRFTTISKNLDNQNPIIIKGVKWFITSPISLAK